MVDRNLWLEATSAGGDDSDLAQARVGAAYGVNPEQRARVEALAKRAGVPPAAAEAQPDLVGSTVRSREAAAALTTAPATRKWMAADQGNADVSHDHVDKLTSFEGLVKNLMLVPRGLASSVPALSQGLWGVLATGAAAADDAGVPGAKQARKLAMEQFKLGGENVKAVAGDDTGTWLGRMVQGTSQSIGLQAPGLAAAVATKNPAFAIAPAMLVQGGQSAGEALEQGKSGGRAALYGGLDAGYEGIFERIPLGKLLGDVAKNSSFAKTFARQLFTEVPTEVATTLSQNLNEWTTLNPDKPFSDFLAEQPAAIRDTVAQVFMQTGAMTGVAHGTQRLAQRAVERDLKAAGVPAQAEQFNKVVEALNDLPLRERAPQRFAALVDEMATGQDIHIPAETVTSYLQSVDPEIAAQFVDDTGIHDQLTATTPGADIVIPAGTYLSAVAPTDAHTFMQNDLKIGQGGMSVNEAKAHEGERDQMLADAAEKALGESEAAAGSPTLRVEQHAYDQMTAAGVPQAQAREMATVMSHHYTARAAANGSYADAWEAYADSNPTFQKGGDAVGRAFTQFAGEKAIGYPVEALDRAKAMETAGELAGDIEEETGWRRGDEGRWRFEISDHDAKLRPDAVSNLAASAMAGSYSTLPDVLEHPALYKAYPALADIRVMAHPSLGGTGAVGQFPDGSTIVLIDSDALDRKDDLVERVLIHEVQHLIQNVEGFAAGASSTVQGLREGGYGDVLDAEVDSKMASGYSDRDKALRNTAFQIYKRSAGEIEARNTEGRRKMTPKERRELPGSYTRDIPADKAVVRFTERTFEQGPKGDVTFSGAGAIIRLFKGRDASTLIHEAAGHLWLEELASDAADPNAEQQVRDDWQAVKDWWTENTAQAAEELKDNAEIQARIAADPDYLQKIAQTFGAAESDAAVRLEAVRPFHEMFARAAERYFMEGKTPTSALRQAMARFRNWIVAVYRDLARLNVPMTDDIRGVFDRLVAVDDEITAATVDQTYAPFFPDAETAGMTPAEYDAYVRAIGEADEAANDRLLGKVMSEIRRTKTAAWNAERDALIEDLGEVVNDTPEMRALTLLESGEVKLDTDAVAAMAGDDWANKLYRRFKPYVGEGLHPDDLADQVGLPSGQALVDALVAMRAENDALRAVGDKRTVRQSRIEAAADAEMLARHGDMLNDGTIGEEAQAAIHDLRRSEVLIGEVRALIRKANANMTVWSDAEMQSWARGKIEAMKLAGVRPHVYLAAEQKAGRDALKALVADDFTTALDAKFRQLLNMQLYRAARDARAEVEKGTKLFDRIVKAKNGSIAKTRNMDMVEAARAILAPYGFGSAKNDADYMTKVRLYDPELWQDLEPGISAALAGAKPLNDLTYAEFASLRELVGQLWSQSRESRVMTVEGQQLEIEQAVEELTQRLADNGIPIRPTGRAPTPMEHMTRLVSGMRAALRRVESWATATDGGPTGPFRRYLWNPVSEAADRYRVDKTKMLARFLAIMTPMQDTLKRGRIDAPELGYTFGYANSGVGKGELLHALLHTGNDSNKRKLLLGRGWATEDAAGNLDTSRWDAFLDRMHREGVVTEADWTFAQAIWDLLEETKPAAQAAHRAVYGRYFEEVTANPVSTPYGQFKGGYVPAVVDTFLVQEQALNAAQDAIESGNDSAMFPSPARGFTKSRVDYNKPLALDLGLLPQHIDKVMKFAHLTGPVHQVLRVLKNRKLASALEAYDPVAVPDLLLPWLNRAAKQSIEVPSKGSGGKAADNFFRAMRTRTGMGIMIGNVSNTLQQFTGLFPAALKVQPGHLSRALWAYTRHPKQLAADVIAASEFMATRTNNQMHEVNAQIQQLLLDPTKYEKVAAFTQRHAYILQGMTQNVVDLVVWQGAYNQALERGAEDEDAVRQADSAVRETQGSLAPEDVSRFETGSPFVRVFTQFYNYFGSQSNLLFSEFGNSRSIGRSFYIYAAGIMLPAVVATAIGQTFGKGWGDDDDDGYWDTFFDVFFGGQFRYATGMLPVAGQMINLGVNMLNDKPYDDTLVAAPAFSSVQSVAQIPKDIAGLVTEGKRQKATVRDTATLATLITGIPLFNVAARPLGYLADVNEGKVKPTDPVDFARGLMTGTASEASKTR